MRGFNYVFSTAISIGTVALEERQLRRTPNAADLGRIARAALGENFGYRQINLVFRLHGIWWFLHKDTSWAAVPRTGYTRGIDDKTSLPLQQERRAAEVELGSCEPDVKDEESGNYELTNYKKTG